MEYPDYNDRPWVIVAYSHAIAFTAGFLGATIACGM